MPMSNVLYPNFKSTNKKQEQQEVEVYGCPLCGCTQFLIHTNNNVECADCEALVAIMRINDVEL